MDASPLLADSCGGFWAPMQLLVVVVVSAAAADDDDNYDNAVK